MRITRRKLKMIIESFLFEVKKNSYVCPKCGHEHNSDSKKDKDAISDFKNNKGKCANCGHEYGQSYDHGAKTYNWGNHPKLEAKKSKNESQHKMLQEKRRRRKRKKSSGSPKETQCPTATVDISVNTANRDRARKLDWIMYGPLNVEFPGEYWKKIAAKWGTSPKAAKKSNCGNCVAFDRSPKMVDECIPAITSEPVADEFGVLGYCWMHHFKCHSARTCNTWAAGGPIKTDKSSAEWLNRNKKGALKKEPIDADLYQDDTEE